MPTLSKFASGLTANDFLRGNSVISFSQSRLREVADDVRIIAEKEGLTAHRDSVLIRK